MLKETSVYIIRQEMYV